MDNLAPDFGEWDYSLDSLADQYRKCPSPSDEGAVPTDSVETAARHSRQVVMDALREVLGQYMAEEAFASKSEPVPAWKHEAPDEPDEPAEPQEPEEPEEPDSEDEYEDVDEEEVDAPEPPSHRKPVLPKFPAWHRARPVPPEEPDDEDEDTDTDEDVNEDEYEAPRHQQTDYASEAPGEGRSGIAERFLRPLIRFAATSIAKKQQRTEEAANWPDPVDFLETEELPPQRAAKFYFYQIRPLRFRWRVCFFMCVVLAWISLGLPMAGILGKSLRVQAGVSLLLLLTVMISSLDILAAGLRQFFEFRLGGEALATMAAFLSVLDGVMVMQGHGAYLPFCAVGAFSLTSAVLGARLTCAARARSLRAVAKAKTPAAVTAEETGHGSEFLTRSNRDLTGVVRRSEEPDFCQNAYATAAPVFFVASFLLAIAAAIIGQGSYFLHNLSALMSVSASFTAFLSFPLPYALAARKLQASGAAVMGWAGCADIGRVKRVVITDNDLFPPGTVKLATVNIQEGVFVEKVISYTVSLLAASGSGVIHAFAELMEHRGYPLVNVEEFKCHQGGGLSALIGGERVLVGSPGFMNLMGIRLPQNMNPENAVCTAISDRLVAVSLLEYVPTKGVQEALATLLQNRSRPIFAIRDFNINPRMIKKLFLLPTSNFNFPPFRDRYRISAAAQGLGPVSAVVTRPGMSPLVDAAESGRKLYATCRIGAILSLLSTMVGLVVMFLLFRAGSYDTATVGNVLSYMLLWALPLALLAFGQNR